MATRTIWTLTSSIFVAHKKDNTNTTDGYHQRYKATRNRSAFTSDTAQEKVKTYPDALFYFKSTILITLQNSLETLKMPLQLRKKLTQVSLSYQIYKYTNIKNNYALI